MLIRENGWIYVANIMVGFIAPLAGVLIGAFSLIPTMRGLYIFAAIMFTIKAIITYQMTQETQQGMIRMHETRHQSLFSALGEYRVIFQTVLRAPQTLYTAGILLVLSISNVISGNFCGIIVTEKLHIPPQKPGDLSICKIGSDVIFLLCYHAAYQYNALQTADDTRVSGLCCQSGDPHHRTG